MHAIKHLGLSSKTETGTAFREMPSADHSIGRSSLKLRKWTMRRQAELCFLFGRELPYICLGMHIHIYSVCRDFVYSVIILYICEYMWVYCG